ncbi:hypothetical protein [Lutimonas zeaxanthinifaciens]|uniref:hypothetical protein n=1 Tax=Lutimonas zeaxanthinifaciens TaxID=3060215 RepID=UPI00265D29B3|nr:hypothetical protein [Lutimonas sp. YSD2104]WKK67266.1 hypothetical protein QZH61_06485 [Lutimonas sp. YSD2104]
MKNFKLTYFISLFVGILIIVVCGSHDLNAQTKKNKARVNADYVKVIDGESYLNIKASARIDRQTVAVSHIDLTVLQELDDEEIEIGKTTTNASGTAKFIIKDFQDLKPDSLGVYNLTVSFAGNDSFKRSSRDVSFRNADFDVNWVVKDSINYVQAKLIDTQLDSVVSEMPLVVRVDRLFRPLKIGEATTDENGEIEVAVEDGIPGIEGNLDLEVVLNESDDYGTVIAKLTAPIGTVIVDESTFDQRTMWSPRGKTPIFLLALTYSFVFIVWGIFLYLFFNLVRIIKS